jgi:hypothetical protein
VVENVLDVVESQRLYYKCIKELKPLLPCFEKALDVSQKAMLVPTRTRRHQ